MSEELVLYHGETASVWEDVPHRCIVCDSMDADFAFSHNYGTAPEQIWMCHHHVWDFILAQAKKERARLGIKTEVEK
jgi:hypothetical protein